MFTICVKRCFHVFNVFYHLFGRLLTMFLYILTMLFPGCWPGCGFISSANRVVKSQTESYDSSKPPLLMQLTLHTLTNSTRDAPNNAKNKYEFEA
jgi:hypothetical protein